LRAATPPLLVRTCLTARRDSIPSASSRALDCPFGQGIAVALEFSQIVLKRTASPWHLSETITNRILDFQLAAPVSGLWGSTAGQGRYKVGMVPTLVSTCFRFERCITYCGFPTSRPSRTCEVCEITFEIRAAHRLSVEFSSSQLGRCILTVRTTRPNVFGQWQG
jgi:hypothetical protein